MKEPKTPSTFNLPAHIGKDEMNLAEYPFSLLTHRIPPARKTYSFTQHIIDSHGKTVKQTWSVLGSDKYGLPTPYDDDVILALLYCYKEQNFQGRKIHFTLYRLCRIMQKTLSKKEYDRIRDSLNRLTSTTIVATNCFYDNAAKSWVSETFHLFDRYKLYQEHKRQGSTLPLSFIELGEAFARSVTIAHYIKDLDLKTYYSLELPISKRLFRYLDKNRYHKSRYEESLMKMAQKLPLNYLYPSQVKQKLLRPHAELIDKHYLTQVTYHCTKHGEEKVLYEFGAHAVGEDRFCRKFAFESIWGMISRGDSRDTRGRSTMAISFKGAHFPQDVILMGVRWYVAYPLSTRHVEERFCRKFSCIDDLR